MKREGYRYITCLIISSWRLMINEWYSLACMCTEKNLWTNLKCGIKCGWHDNCILYSFSIACVQWKKEWTDSLCFKISITCRESKYVSARAPQLRRRRLNNDSSRCQPSIRTYACIMGWALGLRLSEMHSLLKRRSLIICSSWGKMLLALSNLF